jgi:hypothetical protein
MRCFNANFFKFETSFILNGKEWGGSKTDTHTQREREREREREWVESERQSVGEKGLRLGS